MKQVKQKKPIIDPDSPGSFEKKAALVIFGVSGFCAMASEVIWTRLLGLIVGPTTYSFTIVLVTFITGLALGSLIFGHLADRVKNAFRLLLFTQIAAALLVLGISQLLGGSQLFFAKLIFSFKDQFALQSLLKAAFLFGFMILPTLCFGACFPLVGKITTRSVTQVGRSIGLAYMLNTVGALLGPFCAGFVIIPLVGKESGLSLVVGLQLITCLLMAGIQLAKKKQRPLHFAGLAAPLLAGLVLCVYYPAFNHGQLAMGKYHRFENIRAELIDSGWLESLFQGRRILARSETDELVYYGDGIGGFTTVVKSADALGTIKYMLANSGKPDATSRGDMATQTLLAHFPMLFQKNPRAVMVIGLASGVTAGEVLCYPVDKLDILEINDQVVAASNFFTPWNNHALSDPRTRLILQDARAHLQLTGQRYDVIISEPSNPWMAGLAALFTRDFFALAKDRLTDEGVFVQWMHAYQMDWETFALVGRTFAGVFPNSLLLRTEPTRGANDYLLVGFKGQNRLNLAYADPKQAYVQKSGNVTLKDPRLLYRLIVSQNLPKLFGAGDIHTDNHPRLEFTAPKLMHSDRPAIQIYRRIHSQRWPGLEPDTKKVIRQVTKNTDSRIDFAAYALSLYSPFKGMTDTVQATASQKRRIFDLVENYCAENELDYSFFTDKELEQRCLATQIDVIEKKMDRLPNRRHSYDYLGTLYSLKGRVSEARNYYTKAVQMGPLSALMLNNLGVALIETGPVGRGGTTLFRGHAGRPGRRGDHISTWDTPGPGRGGWMRPSTITTRRCDINPNLVEAHYPLGLALAERNRLDEAIRHYSEALRFYPEYKDAHNAQGVALSRQGRLDEAIRHFYEALRLDPDFSGAHNNLGIALARNGMLEDAADHFKAALRINPGFVNARKNLNKILARRKN